MRSITITKDGKTLTFNEIEAVQFAAHFLEVSEYEVFQLGYNDWYGRRMTDKTMDYRFENYLEEDIVPFWVWNFAKGVIEKYAIDQVSKADYGIKLKVLTRSQKIMGWLIVLGVILFSFLYSWLASRVQL
jgi:hypothetical protein